MYRDSHTRSVAKAISWRIFGTIATAILVYIFTRNWSISLTVGAVEFVTKIGLFWLHERAWDRVPLGKERKG
jgi:adenylylsulfate kinase